MQVWAFVSQKGGVGKTTIALHLAAYAEQQGRMTAVLDCDPQTNCVRWAKERGTREPMVFATAPEKLRETIGRAIWADLRKRGCRVLAIAVAGTHVHVLAETPKEAAKKPSKKEAKETAAAPAAPSGPAVYPNAVDPKYSKETAGKARMHTCVDQYNANKASNANGGLKWIQKGGGYYSECTKKLKGAA